jgi:cobalamin-dependent methionine synthase I
MKTKFFFYLALLAGFILLSSEAFSQQVKANAHNSTRSNVQRSYSTSKTSVPDASQQVKATGNSLLHNGGYNYGTSKPEKQAYDKDSDHHSNRKSISKSVKQAYDKDSDHHSNRR